ncbi:hypothetical protein LJC27_03970 [Christensenellaceae bacterium OttesenSCG-928-M15]|nr:hypothetical protein [Christensenellaceae bacterium OttesenSCG-928-M15]
MKKKIAVLLAISLLFVLVMTGCGGNSENVPPVATNTPVTEPSIEPELTPTAEPELEVHYPSFLLTNMDVAIGGAEWVTLSGEEALCIYLDYTNFSDRIIQPSKELTVEAEQNGEGLTRPRGDTQEQRALIENQNRRLFPGAVNRAAVYFTSVDAAAEIVLTFEDRTEGVTEELWLDPANLWDLIEPPVNPPAMELASIQGFSGSKAHFESDFSTQSEGELELLRHEFVEVGGERFVVVYFGIEVTGNMKEDDKKDPNLMTNCFVFQDGVQLGSSSKQDDRMSGVNVYEIYELFPEVAAHMQDIGLNEPVTTAIIYRLRSDSDVSVVAAFNCSDFTKGEAFIGDTFPVE